MTKYCHRELATAADALSFDEMRRALRRFSEAEGIYTAAEAKYDPEALPENSRKARILRKLREAGRTESSAEIEAYVLQKPDLVQITVPPTSWERIGFVIAIIAALLLAPAAVVVALIALAMPSFTGFSDEVFPIALGQHLVYQASSGELLGYAAAIAMLLTFSMANRVMLRLFALIANIFFISYGVSIGLVPVVLLHMVLAPVNLMHLGRALHNSGARADLADLKAVEAGTAPAMGKRR